jgi:hypothetical protein
MSQPQAPAKGTSPADAARKITEAAAKQQPPAAPPADVPPADAPPAAPPNVEECGARYKAASNDELVCRKQKGHGKDALKDLGTAHSSRQPKEKLNFNIDTKELEAGLGFVPEDEILTGIQESGPRSDAQQFIDAQVLEAVQWWREHGKPTLVLSKGIGRRCQRVSPANAAAVREMLKLAGSHHGVRVARSPVKQSVDGYAMIYWFATDRTPREKKDEAAK